MEAKIDTRKMGKVIVFSANGGFLTAGFEALSPLVFKVAKISKVSLPEQKRLIALDNSGRGWDKWMKTPTWRISASRYNFLYKEGLTPFAFNFLSFLDAGDNSHIRFYGNS